MAEEPTKAEWETWRFPGIYSLTQKENGKVYVGQAQNITLRLRGHRNNGKNGAHMYNALKKYGWDAFDVVVLERVDDLTQLDTREQFWIDALHACDPTRGYNICPTAGSCRGYKHTEAERARRRQRRHSEATRAKLAAAKLGHPVSDEARAKIAAAHVDKHPSPETRAKMAVAQARRSPVTNETREKLRQAGRGRKPTAETKEKIRATLTGTHLSEETKAKLRITSSNPSAETRTKLRIGHARYRSKAKAQSGQLELFPVSAYDAPVTL